MIDTGLITSTDITGKVSMAECASGVASSETSSFFFLVTVTTGKSFQVFTINQEKHNAIKLLAQSKLDNIADIVSQTMQDEDISSFEFIRYFKRQKISQT